MTMTRTEILAAIAAGADLRGADLSGADLSAAYLRGAYLRGAVLTGADLSGADLSAAYLRDVVLTGADLTGAYLRGAVLTDAVLTGADLRGAAGLPPAPVIGNLDSAILDAIEEAGGEGHLDMCSWHGCDTTHCRAGWAIVLAGEAGASLEAECGSSVAGALIYAASDPDRPIPDFFASTAATLADLRARARGK